MVTFMNPIFLSFILVFCFAGIANCDEGSQDSEKHEGNATIVDEDPDNQSNDNEAASSQDDENERNVEMLTLLAGTIGREVMPDEAVNMAIAEQSNN